MAKRTGHAGKMQATAIEATVGKLESIHRAGIRVVVDSDSWFRDAPDLAKAQREYPLNPAVSATRVDCVAEGIRIAMMLDRPRVAPDGAEYAHSEADLREAFNRISDYVLKQVKEEANDQPAKDKSGGRQSDDGGAADADSDAPDGAGSADSEEAED